MAAAPTFHVHPDRTSTASAVAAALLDLLRQLIDSRTSDAPVSVVLTGGTIADEIYSAVASSADIGGLDWSAVEFWWGDERFVAAESPDRNELGARHHLLDTLVQNGLPDFNIHPMPAADSAASDDAEAAVSRYSAELARAGALRPSASGVDVPVWDLVLLGIGPDGHCASLFPGFEQLHEHSASVVSVYGSPKPPPTRISLTFRALAAADRVWWLAAGSEKAAAVAAAVGGAPVEQTPASVPHGRLETVWWLDESAAAELAN